MVVLEEGKVITGSKETQQVKYLVKISPLSQLDYRAWLFGNPHSVNKDKLLELTLFAFPPEERSLVYYQMSQSEESFKKILAQKINKIPDCLFSNQWYSYESAGHFYVDFAHPTEFGGAFRSWGNVQEEILFCEFPKLAHLAYATQDHPIIAKEMPFLVPDCKRHTTIFALYGDALEKATREEIAAKIEYLDLHKQPPVHILGMAAIVAGGKQKYEEKDLHTLLKTAFLAFDGAKMTDDKAVIHTGAWGCGVFRNSEKTITVIQLLAAALAEVEIVFEGVDATSHRNYTEGFLQEARQLLSNKKNASDVISEVLKRQERDPSWAPKNTISS